MLTLYMPASVRFNESSQTQHENYNTGCSKQESPLKTADNTLFNIGHGPSGRDPQLVNASY